jgi:hypothetical protein
MQTFSPSHKSLHAAYYHLRKIALAYLVLDDSESCGVTLDTCG